MFAVTIDQRSSRSAGDRVPELLESLAEACADNPPIAGFDRTVGDEVEGLFDDADGVVAAVRAALGFFQCQRHRDDAVEVTQFAEDFEVVAADRIGYPIWHK